MSYEARNHFYEQLGQLSRAELENLFRILKRHNDNYSENSNGILFDVKELRTETFDAMNEYMIFCMKNREEQKARVAEMQNIREECITSRDISDKA